MLYEIHTPVNHFYVCAKFLICTTKKFSIFLHQKDMKKAAVIFCLCIRGVGIVQISDKKVFKHSIQLDQDFLRALSGSISYKKNKEK